MPETKRVYQDKKERARMLVEKQRYAEAGDILLELCKHDEKDVESWFMLGAIKGNLGDIKGALACCSKVIDIEPEHAEAHYNLAQGYRLQNQVKKALASYRQVLRLEPHHVLAQANLISLLRLGLDPRQMFGESRGKLDKNKYSATMIEMGNTAREQGVWGEALACYHEALRQSPGYSDALLNLGLAYQDFRKPEEAVKYLRQAVLLNPGSAEAHFMLGCALMGSLNLSGAVAEYEEALRIRPIYSDALHNMGIVHMLGGDPDEAVKVFHRVLDIEGNRAESRSALLMNLNYRSRNPEEVFIQHLEWEKFHGCQVPAEGPGRSREPERKLRIGYVSPDFRAHSVAFFIEPLLRKHNSVDFEVFCYSDVLCPDLVTRRLRPLASTWREVRNLPNDKLVEQIRSDHVDILVDLAGHTAHNRLEVFAARPAPVQVTWLGYPNTTGLSAIDYRLTDARADPPGKSDHLYCETLVRLPGGFLCYDAHDDSVPENRTRADNGHVTFGSFNNLAKISPEVINLWSLILKAVPNSRLLLKTKPLRDLSIRERLLKTFSDHGIERGRLELSGWVPTRNDHLNLYSRIDIALDTFPYSGTTTTCEALWMGVPVITLAGQTHGGRVGVSLLTQTGLTEYIAADMDEYFAVAVKMASDKKLLLRLRGELRECVASSSLCDATSFAGHVEDAYRKMWRSYSGKKT